MKQVLATREIYELYQKTDIVIIDSRQSAAYNGWPLRGEKKGGHIPNAASFPVDWFNEFSTQDIDDLLQEKGIENKSSIIVSGYDAKEIHATADFLEGLGFSSISVHDKGMLDWMDDPNRPLQLLSNFKHLVHPEWLLKLLNGIDPEPDAIGEYVLAHVNFDNWGDYDEGHIPGAIWLDTLALESEETWNVRTPEELEEELCNHGISKNTTVILYGRTANPNMTQAHPGKQAGQLASMRAALLLMYAGVKDVRVLDGGLGAWLKAGGNITREETAPTPVEATGLNIPEKPELIVSTPKAKEMINGNNSELVSVRSWEEFIGEVSGYHYIEPKGRIPGAVFGNCGSDAYHMENYRNPDDTMKSADGLTASLAEVGIVPEKHIAFYCGTGWRASEAFFSAWLMGWPMVSIYDGGWFEWSSNADNPFETGLP
jgi:molybdopterin synthase sulfurtransferase